MAKTNSNTIVFMLLMLFLNACANKAEEKQTKPEIFRTTLEKHITAVSNRNFEALEPTVAENVKMISPNGDVIDSKKAFVEFHKNWFKLDNWEWKGRILKTESSDSVGYGLVQYQYTEKDSTGVIVYESNAYLLLIFKNLKDGWQLVHDQNTRIKHINSL